MVSSVVAVVKKNEESIKYIIPGLLLIGLGLLIFLFDDGLGLMVRWWGRDEYSHGYMIPLVALYLFWQKLPQLDLSSPFLARGAVLSIPVLMVSLFLYFFGEFGAIYTLLQFGFLLGIYALVLAAWGAPGVRTLWGAMIYLVFMIPLPNFLYNNLKQAMQLISSDLGVFFLRLFGSSVYLEGNVIDLGDYKLQVAEACSGLRYLFPLASISFLVTYLFRGPVWIKLLVFASVFPITIFMNSLRISIIGITVNHWGHEMAEGILHSFEGWFIFIACVVLLLAQLAIYNFFVNRHWALVECFERGALMRSNRDSSRIASLQFPFVLECKNDLNRVANLGAKRYWFLWINLILIVLSIPVLKSIDKRNEIEVERQSFSTFPLIHGQWIGQEERIEPEILNALQLTDYQMASYRYANVSTSVNFYVAYYESQRKGASIHSPSSCIPGGGWVIESLETIGVPLRSSSRLDSNDSMQIKRVVIRKGRQQSLVYYWFQQRGRVIANEYLAKWYLFLDAINLNRTDGALVRLIVPIPENSPVGLADQQLVQFIQDFKPILRRYIPE